MRVAFLFDRSMAELPKGCAAVHPHHGSATREAMAAFSEKRKPNFTGE